VGNSYSWSIDGTAPTGTASTDFVAKLNADAVSTAGPVNGCFAGHCDWRLPLLVELTTIVDLTQGYCGGKAGACIDPLFGPTAASFHWTATTFADHPDGAFLVNFALDYVYPFYKQRAYSVRAVRGAL
jgi:hypothetical protein